MSANGPLPARVHQALQGAAHLVETGDYEGAVSRAYYAMFHAARTALVRAGVETRTHKGLLSRFAEHFVKSGRLPRETYTALQRAFGDRLLADYAEEPVFSREQAVASPASARDFTAAMERMLAEG